MQSFQGIIFIQTQTYTEILNPALAYLECMELFGFLHEVKARQKLETG